MSSAWRLTVRETFSAAHALRNYHGKCERVHGHNFGVTMCVEGTELDSATGMLLDYGTMKRLLRACLAQLDHQFLNELSPFEEQNPSSENIARYLWGELCGALASCADPQAAKVRLHSVAVAEKPGQEAQYLG